MSEHIGRAVAGNGRASCRRARPPTRAAVSAARPARRRRCRTRSPSPRRRGSSWWPWSSPARSWPRSTRRGSGSMTGPAPGCCAPGRDTDAVADRCGQRDQRGGLRLGGHRARPVGGRPDDGIPALAALAGVPGQPVVPGVRRHVDLLRAVAAAPVRRADHRQLGRVLRGGPPGGGRHDLLDGRRLLPGRAGPRPLLDQGGGGRGGRRVRSGPPVPGPRSPRRRAARRGVRRGDRGHRVPVLHPERGVPRRLPARPHRARGCDRPAGAGDPPGRARPARAHRDRDQAGRPGVLRRLHAAAAAGRGQPGGVRVRQALHQGPRPRRPLVQAVADHLVRLPGGRAPLPERAAPGRVRGLCPAPAAGHRGPHGPAVRHRGDHPRARVHAGHRIPCRRRRNRRSRRRRHGDRPGAAADPHAVGRRDRPPRHQTGQPDGPLRGVAADRRGLRPGPPVTVAAGGRPGQHDAGPRGPHRPAAGLPAGAGVLHRSRARRSVRRHPRGRQPDPAARLHETGPARPARRIPRPGPAAAADRAATLEHPAGRPGGRDARRHHRRRVRNRGRLLPGGPEIWAPTPPAAAPATR